MKHFFKYSLLLFSLLFFSFEDADIIKPLHIKQITEYSYRSTKTFKTDLNKTYEKLYSKDGRVLKTIGYSPGDTVRSITECTYNKKLQLTGWEGYSYRNKDQPEFYSMILEPKGDKYFRKDENPSFKSYYMFDKQYRIVTFSSGWESYKAFYDSNRITTIKYYNPNYSEFQFVTKEARYKYIKKANGLTIREKTIYSLEPFAVAPTDDGTTPTREKETPSEYITFNNKNEIIQKIILNSKFDTTFYSYKYEYYQ